MNAMTDKEESETLKTERKEEQGREGIAWEEGGSTRRNSYGNDDCSFEDRDAA